MGGIPFQNQPQNVVRTDPEQAPAVPLVNRAVDEVGRMPFPRTTQLFVTPYFDGDSPFLGLEFETPLFAPPVRNNNVIDPVNPTLFNPFLWDRVLQDRGSNTVNANVGVPYPLLARDSSEYYDRFQVSAPAERPMPVTVTWTLSFLGSDPLPLGGDVPFRSSYIRTFVLYRCVGGPAKGRGGECAVQWLWGGGNTYDPVDFVASGSATATVVIEKNCVYEFALMGGQVYSPEVTLRYGPGFVKPATTTGDIVEEGLFWPFSSSEGTGNILAPTGTGNTVGFEDQPVSSFTITTY